MAEKSYNSGLSEKESDALSFTDFLAAGFKGDNKNEFLKRQAQLRLQQQAEVNRRKQAELAQASNPKPESSGGGIGNPSDGYR